MVMGKALILAHEDQADWHPWSAIASEVLEIFCEDFECRCLVDQEPLLSDWDELSLVINLRDQWESPPSEDLVRGLARWVSRGGGLLSIHQGISLARDIRFRNLLGGQFTQHPEPGPICFQTRYPGQWAGPGADGITFTVKEEAYQVEAAPGVLRKPILWYRDGQCASGVGASAQLAGWYVLPPHGSRFWPPSPTAPILPVRPCQVAWLMPGHYVETWRHWAYQALLRQIARRCAGFWPLDPCGATLAMKAEQSLAETGALP